MQEFDTGVACYLLDGWRGVLFYHVSLKYQVCCNYCKLQKLNVWTICNHSVSSSSAVVYCSSILIVYIKRLFWRKGLLKGRSGQRRAWGGRDRGLVVFMFITSNWITLSYSFLHSYQPQLWTLMESVCVSHMRISPTGCQTSTLPFTLELLGEVKLEQSICLPMSLVCFPLWHRNSIFLSAALTPHRPTDFLLNCLMLRASKQFVHSSC